VQKWTGVRVNTAVASALTRTLLTVTKSNKISAQPLTSISAASMSLSILNSLKERP
jgi:hypothetical protein